MATKIIKVGALARVEGEGSLYVRIKDDTVTDVRFGIFEPPRFFEAFLVGRDYSEAPDLAARICGICPVAYELGAILAMEDVLGVTVSQPINDLRRLIYCGEWIESHGLHTYLLHAPDFLGLADALELAKVDKPLVERALRLKKIGNDILEIVGGRAVHPVNLKVGGFYRSPRKAEIRRLRDDLKWAIDESEASAKLFSGFDFPDFEQDYTFIALRHERDYAIHQGRLVSNRGLDVPVSEFLDHFDEEHVEHSNALQGYMKAGTSPYMLGPLARYAINHDRLSERARAAARSAGLGPVVLNPFRSIIVRAVEMLQACEDALALVEGYDEPDRPAETATPRAGVGHGCTEAPRGVCYHRYQLAEDGSILDARIIPPTSQNQKAIEDDLRRVVEANLDLAPDALQWRCEQAIRNYDPCISCATHFLTLTVEWA
ncbi:Ni/Fe hydrogenase subunit alpha [Telmatospirillum sp.]|uniref:Ni/Fe hydrogenase subunit alpha n=1 Tax=Telmatospirillum sp. TaxID=2079197 RepID=UPI00283E7D84|nr:Ni/Fe hydrogenase subunit alpha [Telmatospirillum sp.]MDR3440892.1 Ni/Fe hydrogenase subunit alpha [Telmatospirillum sp.]